MITNQVAELNCQRTPAGHFVLDGHGCWPILVTHTFREMLVEAYRRGQLFYDDRKVIRFEGDLCPVVEGESKPLMALAIFGSGWTFWGGKA